MIKNGADEIDMVINTVEERRNAINDSKTIRTNALQGSLTYFTTIAGAQAAVQGMLYMRETKSMNVYSLQDLHEEMK